MKINKEINIPNDLSEITLDKFQMFKKYLTEEPSDIDINIYMVGLFCDLTLQEVRGLDKDDFVEISLLLTKTINKQSIFVDRFTLNGIEYGFIPNIDKMSFGEYIDLDTYIKNPDDMNKVMSILYRPIIKKSFGKYLIVDYTGEEDYTIMDKAPMNAVNGAMVFFYHLGSELLKSIQNYLQSELKILLASGQVSEKDGDGIVQCMQSLEDNLPILMKLLHTEYIKY